MIGTGSESPAATGDPRCVVCEKPAAGLGPFARQHLCQQHLSVDVEEARQLKEQVSGELRTYLLSTEAIIARQMVTHSEVVRQRLQDVEQRFDAINRLVDAFRDQLTKPLKAELGVVDKCKTDFADVESYHREIATAESADNLAEVVQLADSMQLSIPDLKTDFDKAFALCVQDHTKAKLQLHRLQQLEELAYRAAEPDTAPERSCDAEMNAKHLREASSQANLSNLVREVELKGPARWLAVCHNPAGFSADSSGRVVRSDKVEVGDNGSVALPKPSIFVRVIERYLTVLPLDGTAQYRCHCEIDWEKSIWGLYCGHQQLFIAQEDSVIVTDLSGRNVRKIQPSIEGFGDIGGIGGDSQFLYLSSKNKIAAISKATNKIELMLNLSDKPNADLGSLVVDGSSIFVADHELNQVHMVEIKTRKLVSIPTPDSGMKQLSFPMGLALDSRGRLFISEHLGHCVRAFSARNGALLFTHGTPGEQGGSRDQLNCPWGVEVARCDSMDYLLVSDCCNHRLLVLRIND